MSNSAIAKLGDVAEINPDSPERLETDFVPFIPMADVSAERATVTPRERRKLDEVSGGLTYFQADDVLVAKITPCFENGKVAQVRMDEEYGFGSTEFHVLRSYKASLDSRYLLHYLRQKRIRIEGERRMTGSAGQRRVPVHFFRELGIPLPTLSEQRRIAAILDQADNLRTKRTCALHLIKAAKKKVFLEMFGHPDANPKNWPCEDLESIIVRGPQNGIYKPASFYGSGTSILRIDAFYDGAVTDLASLKRVSVSDEEQGLYGLYPNDIVINRVNSIDYLGKSAIIPPLTESVVFESNMMRFAIDERRAEPTYIVEFLQTGFVKRQILRATKDAVNQSSINQQDVKRFRILLPPLGLQRKFCAVAALIDRLEAIQKASAVRLHALSESLQHRAFRGEL